MNKYTSRITKWKKTVIRVLPLLLLAASSSSCWLIKAHKPSASEATEATTGVVGASIGSKAGSMNSAELETLYAMTTAYAPAAVRPDPDVYVRKLLLQHRSKGATVAREIGRVEQFKLLMGGATEDFAKKPSTEYDATSFLAMIKVNAEICTALVAPTASDHPGWSTILLYSPDKTTENLQFLAQRFLGKPSSKITTEMIDNLKTVMDANTTGSSYTNSSYVSPCVALSMDAESLLL